MLKVYSPYDQKLIKEIKYTPPEEIDDILQKAYNLFNDRNKWLEPWQRKEILAKTAAIMRERLEELTLQAAAEGGKPYKDSKVEVLRAINGVELAMENMGQMKGEEVPMGLTASSTGRLGLTKREPIGVVVSVSAFNHPLNLAVHQIIPAIAVGAPVIIKPALTTPLSAISLGEILKEAGLPDGWCRVVICDNKEAERLATDKRVNYLSFIGSAAVGWHLRSKLAPGTRAGLEHGGVAPVIVEPDADLKEMIPLLAKGGFYHAGQVCVSVQRVYIHESILEKVSKLLKEETLKLKTGDPLDPGTDVGPFILHREANRVSDWVDKAIEEGAELVCGGKKLSDSLYEPTILLNPSKNSWVSTEELFGPVICLYSYSSLEDAIERANSLPYAFQSAIFTKNIDRALLAADRLNASTVSINDHTAFRVDWMPFGGRDISGMGVGGIQYSMREMSREKLMIIKSSSL